MLDTPSEFIEQQNEIEEVSALCRAALQRLGTAGHFRVRVLLEMAIIQLEVDAPKPPAQDITAE